MRPRRLAPAAALLAALALALGACTGGEPPPAATPEASPAAEAPSTPAPTAEATPSPVATPEPPPEAACANGVAVEEPEARPGLVADCVALLASRDALRGEASLDWGGGLAIGRWEGVAVEGEPPRVTGLDLSDKGLTGSIPRGLRRLRLDEVRLAGNALTGCVPSAFGDARGDAAYLGLPWCLRYDRLDATGAVAEAGGWAILGAGGEVLATWEGLRSEAATLRVHQTDAGGTSWAPEFGAVSEGDLFEWRKASDCWVRYLVTGPPVHPSAGYGRWEFPVEWMTYAATGEGCTGAVGSAAVLGADEAAPRVIPATAIDAPVRHGPWLLRPWGWEGAVEEPVAIPTVSGDPFTVRPGAYTEDIAVARGFPRWREPAMPAGWRFGSAATGPLAAPADGYTATYVNAKGYFAATIYVARGTDWPLPVDVLDYGPSIFETRIIDGLWAIVFYAPGGRSPLASTAVQIFDDAAGIFYTVHGRDRSITGHNIEPLIEIARSLLPTDTPEATRTAEAPSTPAPTATVTAEAPPPEVACANGVAVEEPEARPGLVADCVALLASRDALRGEASLDWGGGLAIGRWEGVAVEGEPPRVVRLDLRDRGLTGSIPRTLWRLRLDEVRLAGNALTGCVPSAFEDASTHDVASLALPWCLRYDRLDATSEVAEAGGWAVLDADGEVLATWEGLRSEAATLRVHQTDAGGTSWAPEFGAVSEGGLFEWRKASDCWVRYRVTGPPVRPSAGSGRWEFPVEWRAYAATGEGCTGTVGASAVLRADEDAPATVSTAEIASPVRYGPYLLAPRGWEGEIEQPALHVPSAASGGGASGASGASARPGRSPFVYTQDLAEARRVLPLWRDPVLPAGWTFHGAEAGTVNSPYIGYCADYLEENGYFGATICVRIPIYRPDYAPVLVANGSEAFEARMIGGYVARVRYSPQGAAYDRLLTIVVQIFDADTGIEYEVAGHDPNLKGSNVDSVIAIARSLLPTDGAP